MRPLALIALTLWTALCGLAAEISQAPAVTSAIAPSPSSIVGRRNLQHQIARLVLPEIQFNAIPLAEVVTQLSALARQSDPGRRGINFLILDPPRIAISADAPGNPAPAPATPPTLRDGLIHVREPLKNLALREALEAVCLCAEMPTRFCIEQYAITFVPRAPGGVFTRPARANPDTFRQGLPGVVPAP